jgi:hypothetical protein
MDDLIQTSQHTPRRRLAYVPNYASAPESLRRALLGHTVVRRVPTLLSRIRVQVLPAHQYGMDMPIVQQESSRDELLLQLLQSGLISRLPTYEAESASEQATEEALAKRFGGGPSASQLVNEVRGEF